MSARSLYLLDSRAASLPLAERPDHLPVSDGWTDYAAPLDPDLVMEQAREAQASTPAANPADNKDTDDLLKSLGF